MPKALNAPIPRDGGPTIAPKTRRSRADEGHHGRVAYNVLNMRLTEAQVKELGQLRDVTGITVQAHIRRAVLDYLYHLRLDRPDLFVKR
jgi:hypothetical protein